MIVKLGNAATRRPNVITTIKNPLVKQWVMLMVSWASYLKTLLLREKMQRGNYQTLLSERNYMDHI